MSSDRAAVAREVLTELANWNMARVETLKDAMRFRDERYPAPAAPVTVTVVDGDGVQMKWKKGEGGYWVTDSGHVLSPASWAHSFAERVASDARRIEELERELESATERERARWVREQELDRERQEAICERDEARRLYRESEAARALANDNTRLWRERVTTGLGASTTEEGHVERSSTSAPAQQSPSPAPIPLGATVEVEGTRWVLGTGDDEEEWCTDDGTTTRTHDHDAALAALYHARHPVADAATVERVARAILDNDREQLGPSDWEWNVVGESVRGSYLSNARAALRALGIQEVKG